ncbi:magnesium and cobalt transport protein CorA [Pseudoflavitalea sp. G-6-1-2]|uniref:magnesium and cobalt transport protein CorA n=1 Tax=Pseudoflavitalea sp. G-6-1-2 TaxID=2728841 RepID=UPI00146EEE3D|nr:magnesium and cobalt transport protein CorA [Pseudoflavitalea sp. G-6-1-2]NML22436.1 magnesium and cobalt transport protein CorA [Pseudoflavitalea sp. G-6-1-2]
MFEKNDKRRLYQLMDMYLSGNISDKVFCDEFYYSYDLEIDLDTLTDIEKKAFSELSTVSDRFSEFEEDHIKYPKGFYTSEELKQKITETKEKLQEQSSQ